MDPSGGRRWRSPSPTAPFLQLDPTASSTSSEPPERVRSLPHQAEHPLGWRKHRLTHVPKDTSMAHFVVLGVDNPDDADWVFDLAGDLTRQQLLESEDADLRLPRPYRQHPHPSDCQPDQGRGGPAGPVGDPDRADLPRASGRPGGSGAAGTQPASGCTAGHRPLEQRIRPTGEQACSSARKSVSARGEVGIGMAAQPYRTEHRSKHTGAACWLIQPTTRSRNGPRSWGRLTTTRRSSARRISDGSGAVIA